MLDWQMWLHFIRMTRITWCYQRHPRHQKTQKGQNSWRMKVLDTLNMYCRLLINTRWISSSVLQFVPIVTLFGNFVATFVSRRDLIIRLALSQNAIPPFHTQGTIIWKRRTTAVRWNATQKPSIWTSETLSTTVTGTHNRFWNGEVLTLYSNEKYIT